MAPEVLLAFAGGLVIGLALGACSLALWWMRHEPAWGIFRPPGGDSGT
jgi:hypothetical protein